MNTPIKYFMMRFSILRKSISRTVFIWEKIKILFKKVEKYANTKIYK